MYSFLSGILVLGLIACGIFFFKYWLATRDRLFVCFSLAFWLLALQRILLVALHVRLGVDVDEKAILYYSIRCAAFLLILFAIVDKGRRQLK